MTTAEAPAPVPVQDDDQICRTVEDQIGRTLEDLHSRARETAANLADIHARVELLEKEIERHQPSGSDG